MDRQWSAASRLFILILLIAGGIWLASGIMPLLQAIGIAALLALLLNPLVNGLMRLTRLRRPLAATLIFLVVLALLIGLPVWMGSLAVAQITRLVADLSAAGAAIQEWLLQPIDILGYRLEPQAVLGDFENLLSDTLATLPRGSLNVVSVVTTNLLWALTVVVTLYYLLKDGHKVKPWLASLAPEPYRPEFDRLLDEIDTIWGRFLRIQVGLFFLLTLLLAIGTGLVILLFRTGLIRLSPLGFILLLILVYTAIQQVDNLWLRPQFMSRHLRLHPAIVFVGLVGGLAFSGLVGAIVVVPAIATARVVGGYLHRRLLGLPPWPAGAATATAAQPAAALAPGDDGAASSADEPAQGAPEPAADGSSQAALS